METNWWLVGGSAALITACICAAIQAGSADQTFAGYVTVPALVVALPALAVGLINEWQAWRDRKADTSA